ncbi:ABC transporter ATP-binding protein [Loigolactobacillus binensis]|uniref:ABC transporter ATP-binding protein n=1 Tax=Loigolactobacillus binensis TaxID=2559922 RepID=A0ABW3EAW9_9LACO|nr:ABC transporter ATP-binding protein [Loigolactobacillus binensis]
MKTLIQAQHLQFSYGTKLVLNNLNFTIYAGEIIGLIGENGAGKTTLLNILLGVYSASGKITLFEQRPGSKFVKARIGSMRQTDMVMQGVNVLELLTEVATCYSTPLTVDQLLNELQLTEIASKRLTNLSGGQLRRVTFAVALIGDPDLLFLDEPTVGMDVNARRVFWRRIQLLKQQGKTIIITSHYLNEIQDVADRLLLMHAGHFIFQGTFSKLQKQNQRVTITFQTQIPVTRFKTLPGVTDIRNANDQICIKSVDGDITLTALTTFLPQLRQITVTRESLEDIFIHLTNKEL